MRNNTLSLQQQIRLSVLAMKLLSITHLTCQAATDFSGSPVQIIPPPVPDEKYSHRQNSRLGKRRKGTLENASHNVSLVYLGFVFLYFVCFLFCFVGVLCLHFGGGTEGQKLLSREENLNIHLNVSLEQTWPLSS